MITDPRLRTDESILSVRGLTAQFRGKEGTVRAVRGIDLDLRREQKLGIVGESGSGKSTLALSLVGLLEPPGQVVGGEVWLNGRQLRGLSDRALRHIRGREIALIFQDPASSFDPIKSIGDQVGEALKQHGRLSRRALRRRVIELLQEVEILNAERRLRDYPHQYSGGMRQRVMIAIALANNPDVLIADEPTAALDVTTQAQVLSLLERLTRTHGSAVLLITHNLGIVAEFCDSVRVMYAGRFVEAGSTAELFARPAHPYSRALLESVPRPDRRVSGPLASIPGQPPNLATLPLGCSFEPRCPRGNGVALCCTTPPPRIYANPESDRYAECHFAREAFDSADNALHDAELHRHDG